MATTHSVTLGVHSLEGAEIARVVSIACFSLIVYEYFITFDEEVKYFWTGKWNTSRILFLMNRYLPLGIIIFSITCFSIPDPSPEFCKPAIQLLFLLNIISIIVIQGILVIRIWYLFQGSKRAQIGIIVGFIISVVLSLVLLYLSANDNQLHIIPIKMFQEIIPEFRNEGCKAARPPNFWRIYLPSLMLHTVMYIMTGIRALRNRRLLKNAPVLKRLLRDGGFFYFVVFVSVTLTAIGSMLTQYPRINIPSIYSHFLLTLTSVAVSRVLFSIHSLADKLHTDSAWILSNVELSRVGWRVGKHDGELIVESYPVYAEDEETGSVASEGSDRESVFGIREKMRMKMRETRVGVFKEDSW